jgi:hypothetical protein
MPKRGCDGANLRSLTVTCGPQDTDHNGNHHKQYWCLAEQRDAWPNNRGPAMRPAFCARGCVVTTAVIALDAAGVCLIGAAVLVVAVFWIEAVWKS